MWVVCLKLKAGFSDIPSPDIRTPPSDILRGKHFGILPSSPWRTVEQLGHHVPGWAHSRAASRVIRFPLRIHARPRAPRNRAAADGTHAERQAPCFGGSSLRATRYSHVLSPGRKPRGINHGQPMRISGCSVPRAWRSHRWTTAGKETPVCPWGGMCLRSLNRTGG